MSARVAVPSERASFAGVSRAVSEHEWEVPAGLALEAFVYANGPPNMVQYNLRVVRRNHNKPLCDVHASHDKQRRHDLADVLGLTAAGAEILKVDGGRRAFLLELACSGAAAHGKQAPNCRRTCCGGIGVCTADCTGRGRFDNCGYRVNISASLEQAASRHHPAPSPLAKRRCLAWVMSPRHRARARCHVASSR